MSGGSFNYIYLTLERECAGELHDAEMNDLLTDFVEVLHDLEWWQSGDTSEDDYRETVAKFKKKWFGANREERLKGYVDQHIATMRKELYELLGVGEGEQNEQTTD